MGLDYEYGAVVDNEAGTVVEVNAVPGQECSHGLQCPGLVVNFNGQDFEKGNHESLGLDAPHSKVAFVHKKLHDAEAATVSNGDPVYIDAGIGKGFGNAGGLAGLIFDKYGD